MTAVAAASANPGPVRAEGSEAQGSQAFQAEVAKAAPNEPPEARSPGREAPVDRTSGNLVAPKEASKPEAGAQKPDAGGAEAADGRPKAEPSRLSRVNHHSNQLGSLRSAIADAEELRGSQSPGLQALNNGLSFVNGERTQWERANATVGDYEAKLDAYAQGARGGPSAEELKASREAAETAVRSYTGRSVAGDVAGSAAVASGVVRGEGVIKAVGGTLQAAAGAGMLAAPEPTMLTKVGGGISLAHGLDTTQAGLRQALTGERTNTFAHDGSAAAARGLGADEGTAEMVGAGVETAAGIGVPTGLVRSVSRNMDDGMRLAPALAKAGRDAVVDGVDAARRFGRDLMGGAPKSPAETVLDQIGGNPDLQEAARRSEAGMPRAVAAARDDSVVASLDPYNPADLPPPIPLDEKGLFGRGGLVDHDRYPNLYRTELPNGATALYDGVFQATRLSDPDFFNDLKDVMQAVDDAGHRRPVEVVTRSGKTVTGQSLPPGAEAQAYRMDDLVAKVKRDDVARYQSPTDKMMAVQDLQNSPEAAKWEHEAGLEIGDVLFALTGPEDARRSSDLLIQPYYPSESRGPLVGVDEAGTALEQLQTALDRAGHRGVRIDDGGSNIATTGDRHVFFDPVARRAREQNDRKNAWVERRDRY